jgi:ubiquinone/menaquinone biosynthesis C-methylase UbiE
MASLENHAVQQEFSIVSRAYTAGMARRDSREDREILSWLQPRPSDRVLDAACGTGILDRALARRVRKVFGLDLSWQMIERGCELRGVTPSGPIFTVGSITQLPYAARSFDLITCSYAFANLPDPLDALVEFARVVKPRGRIAIMEVVAPEEPNRRAYLNHVEELRGSLRAKILGTDEFLALFGKARLRLVSVYHHRRRRTGREWLSLSPAATDGKKARQLWQMLADSISGDRAGLHPRRAGNDIIFYHATAWFLLRPQRRAARC